MEGAPAPSFPVVRRLGELLVEAGLVEPHQIDRALIESRQTGEPLGKILLKRGLITDEELGQILSAQAGTTYVNIIEREFNRELLDLFSLDFLARHKLLPLSIQDGVLHLAMVHPNDTDTLDEIRLLTGLKPKAHVTTSKQFEDAFQALTASLQGQVNEAIASIRQEAKDDGTTSAQGRLADEMAIEDQPVVRLLNTIITDAIARGASDIHLEARERALRVRLRVDGVMIDATDIPKEFEALAITRLKIMASMDIAEKRKPLDGRSRLSVNGRFFDLRINTMPTIWGETAVIRVLRPTMLIGGLDNLGLYPEVEAQLKNLIEFPHGIVLATGPTGSGKTTSLYSALYELNTPDRNILTVEDPVEFPLEGISQTQVNPKSGLTFAEALRAMLRQDPDIIMLGEIRDHETLNAAVFAALTGHLVLSTIHTNDACSTPIRMMEMGLPAYLLTSSVRGIIAQRLVRRLCPNCKVPAPSTPGLPEVFAGLKLFKPVGCARCRETGFAGRIGIFEILMLTTRLQDMLNTGASAHQMREAAVEEGMIPLANDALRKVADGMTTPHEIARALGTRWTDELCLPSSIAP